MTESRLIAQVEPLLAKIKPGEAFGLASPTRWQGGPTIALAGTDWRVVQCDSSLAIRAELAESTHPLVIVTSLPNAELGEDVRARLYKQRLLDVEPWPLLLERFRAKSIHPSLRFLRYLAEAAADLSTVPPPVTNATVTPDDVWELVAIQTLGISAKPDLQLLLEWLFDERTPSRWNAFDARLRDDFRHRLKLQLGEVAPLLLSCLDAGHSDEVISIGLALAALADSPVASVALARLERFTGGVSLAQPQIAQWQDGAHLWAVRLVTDPKTLGTVRDQVSRADLLLESIGAAEAATNSLWSFPGFRQRLAAFAAAVNRDDPSEIRRTFEAVEAHLGVRHFSELGSRLDKARMAARLCRWLQNNNTPATNVDEAIGGYRNDSSWVDWARYQLRQGDESEAINRSYAHLFERVVAKRERENRTFAAHLAAATASNGTITAAIPIESVLDLVVAPLARTAPAGVLVVVMDGMSWAVLRELTPDLERNGWKCWAREDVPNQDCALAALPSVTAFSRTSLLCGKLLSGTQATEKKGFEDHPGLRKPGKLPPVLFHKDEIGTSGGNIAEVVRLEIRNPKRLVVGAVINAVDDSLGGPEQITPRWDIAGITPLPTLIGEARDANRVVILVSDHGHVLDHGATLSRFAGASDRWRTPAGNQALSPDEILISGPRVLSEGHTAICPATEAIRYTPNRRKGYHGGLTPQECLAPIAVIAPALADIPGWQVQAAAEPIWWSGCSDNPAEAAPVIAARKVKVPARPAMPLFEAVEPAAPVVHTTDWVTALLESEIFAQQLEIAGGRLRREQIEQPLRLLAARNGVLVKSALAQQAGIRNLQVDGWLASLQRVLNVDGYPVLTVDSTQTVRLNMPQVREQFGLKGDRK